MTSISLQNVGFVASVSLFENLNITIGENDRVGLIAGNGGGKTTLLNCVAGKSEPTSGAVVCSRGMRIGNVPQGVPEALLGLSMYEAVRRALPAGERDGESWRVDVALDEFETPDALRERPVKALSGGWQRLMLIARVWINAPDALLLDEPTNHLDLEKLFQLEAWLNQMTQRMPVVIASHDRDFLDATTNRTLFLRPSTSHYFSLPYSRARAALDEADTAMERQHKTDLKTAKNLRRNAAKLSNIGINSGSDLLTLKAKYLKERAAKIEDAARPKYQERSGDIRLANSGTHAKVLLALEDVLVTTPSGQSLFGIEKLLVFQGDRIVILGANGTGKSQFVKMLNRAIAAPEQAKNIRVTPSLVSGYVDQDMSQLDGASTPRDLIGDFKVGDARVRALLAAAGFPIEKQGKPVSEFSFGQRARLGLLALRLTEPNFYLMDEPTNHVDIPAREKLEAEILTHQASCILVSHDRSFARNIGTRYLEIAGGKILEVPDPEAYFTRLGAPQK